MRKHILPSGRSLCARLAVLLCGILVSICFTGCHGSKETIAFVTPEEFDTSRNYEITFWAKNDTNKAQTLIYEKAIADFQALYPNISVNLRLYTDYVKLYNDVITNIATATTPNVCITYPDHVATYMTGENVMVPLDDLFADEKYGLGGSEVRFDSVTQQEIIPQFLKECKIGQYHYAIPYMRSTEACYINKTYVEAMGYTIPEQLTWDFIWEVSDAAMAKDAEGNYLVNGQKVMIPFIYKSTDNMMIQLLRQSGADYSTPDGDILIFNDTTKAFLYEISSHVKKGAFSTFKISSYPGNFLNAGQCLFAIDSTAGATWMGSEAPLSDIHESKVVQFETVVKPIPQVDPEHPQMISQGPSICIFNKEDPQEVLASWLFAQYMLTNDVQIAYSETEGYVPVTSRAQNSAEYLDYLNRIGEDDAHYTIKIQAARILLDNVGYTFTTPVFNGSASLRDAAGQLIEDTCKSTRRKETIDEAYMAKLYDNVTSLYRLGEANASTAGKKDLGPLPGMAIALLVVLGMTWVFILLYMLSNHIKIRKNKKEH